MAGCGCAGGPRTGEGCLNAGRTEVSRAWCWAARLGWHEEEDSEGSEREVKPFPSRAVSQVALAIIFIASIFVLVSVLWQHTASVAASIIAQDLGNGSVLSGVGTSAMVLGWFSFTLLIIVTIGLLVMILSIRVLAQIMD